MKGPFCIVTDDDGHHYVIQSKRREQWRQFLMDHDSKVSVMPKWAHRIDGPGSIDFIDFTERA
jgi:hypothetical protein